MNTGVRTDLESTIRAHPGEPDDFLVSWVVVAEWLHTDGTRDLTMSTNEEMTPWLRRGILEDAIEGEGWE
jgi:hypothetical protein